jgi:hypothetical protein
VGGNFSLEGSFFNRIYRNSSWGALFFISGGSIDIYLKENNISYLAASTGGLIYRTQS